MTIKMPHPLYRHPPSNANIITGPKIDSINQTTAYTVKPL